MIMMINAEGLVAGRLASKVAKALITGETITVVNAEKVVMVGNKKNILAKYEVRVNASVKSNPHRGPKYDRIPSKMFRKMVKGMLPNKKRTSESLLGNLTVFNSVPAELKDQVTDIIVEAKFNDRHDVMTFGEIAKLLGGKW
jgi:large subunit ribosomal protein L13